MAKFFRNFPDISFSVCIDIYCQYDRGCLRSCTHSEGDLINVVKTSLVKVTSGKREAHMLAKVVFMRDVVFLLVSLVYGEPADIKWK